MSRPTLHLLVGLPASGKTTLARRLEVERGALRLTKDEWVKALCGDANPPEVSDVVEGRLLDLGLRCLELGVDVVVDFGLWGRDERRALRAAAAERGAHVETTYLAIGPTEQRARLARRQREAPGTSWPMSPAELARWAATFEVPGPGELDGSEPVGDPPDGRGTWEAWRRHRWPGSVR